jgi:glycogen operon protein
MSTEQTKNSETENAHQRDLDFDMGSPAPLGASLRQDGINFAIFSKHATAVTLELFQPGEQAPFAAVALDPSRNRTGQIWHVLVRGIGQGIQYAYRMACEPNPDPSIHRFDWSARLLDPSAKSVAGRPIWGYPDQAIDPAWKPKYLRRGVATDDDFDWKGDRPLNTPLSDSVIYELHARGFTRHPSSGVQAPGTFAGLIEKIPYLQKLGITAVELLPVNEFEETEPDRVNPTTGERLLNYWGYQPVSFFAPKSSYASTVDGHFVIREFKEMVRQLHLAGIEVILDIVLNHTAEGNQTGPTFSFRGIDNAVYYLLKAGTGEYLDFSGCGNTLNCNHPVVREMGLRCLRYWVTEMHVDGFRFDLASILGRGSDGSVLPNAPFLEMIAGDPVLADTKIIAEAWDAAGVYQVGSFQSFGRWAEWNAAFRDDIRRFVKSDPGMVSSLAARLVGSPDLYEASHRAPQQSINFITCHDGFTLADLVSYSQKHNEANGGANRDGNNENLSWNCGSEGPSSADDVERLRSRQIKNFATLLLISQGVPLILGGDEFRRSQRGNNNAYCQDNEISWIDWQLQQNHADMHRFFQLLIGFRKRHKSLRPNSFTDGPKIEWHGVRLGQPDWSQESRSLAMHLSQKHNDLTKEIYLIANSYWNSLTFDLPALFGRSWHRFLDTSFEPPDDILDEGCEAPLDSPKSYTVGPRSVVVLVGGPAPSCQKCLP